MTGFGSSFLIGALLSILGVAAYPAGAAEAKARQAKAVSLQPCQSPSLKELRCGTYEVYENRRTRRGRKLPLGIVVIPAQSPSPSREAIFFILGGPGQTATAFAPFLVKAGLRRNHDVVLFDQRGTGEGHDLACRMSGSDDNLQGYLEPMFQVPLLRACRSELEKKADLTQYTTPVASADLDEVRRALRYDKIYMTGASYGARAILDYVRRYGKHVRGVVMTSVQPPSIKNPLFLPRAAEDAINGLLAACDSDPACKAAYADVRGDLAAVRSALAAQPARVSVRHPATGAPASILLSERAFVEALRVMLYSAEGARRVPLLLARARQGDLAPFAEAAVASNRALRNQIRFGMLLSVLCNEDMARTSEAEIDRETAGTLLGADRVRQQQAVCSEWPRAKVPADYARPFRSNVPAVIVSGDLDPATSRQAGVEMGRFFPDHIHLVVPGGHSPTNACLQSIGEAFFDSPSLKGLDTSCVGTLRPPPFALPQPGAAP